MWQPLATLTGAIIALPPLQHLSSTNAVPFDSGYRPTLSICIAAFRAVLIAYASMKIDLSHPITIAEALILLVGALTLVAALIEPGRRIWRTIRGPLRMEFHVPDTTEDYENSCTVGKGLHTIKLRIETRVPSDIALIDIKFVKGWWRWRKNASEEAIRISNLSKIEWSDIQVGLSSGDQNGVGGLKIVLQSQKRWTAGVYLYLTVSVEARAAWSGFLSVQAFTNHRPYVRRRFMVADDAYVLSVH